VTAFGPWKVNSKLAKMPKSAPFAANVLWLEEAWAKKGLTLRGRRPGDRFTPSGMGVPKKLQDYMVDAKIPRAERDSLPLLCASGDILWVAGHRASALSTHPATGKRALRIAAIPM
jgi:tRNA(Ile)-lysidine synthetase-like protein